MKNSAEQDSFQLYSTCHALLKTHSTGQNSTGRPSAIGSLGQVDAVSTFSGADGLREICDLTGAGADGWRVREGLRKESQICQMMHGSVDS